MEKKFRVLRIFRKITIIAIKIKDYLTQDMCGVIDGRFNYCYYNNWPHKIFYTY